MEPFINNIEQAVSNVDTTVGDVLQDKYFFIISVVLILLLGSLNSTIVNKQIFYLYDNSLTRLVIMGLIYYVSTKNVSLAVLMLASLLISMNTYNKFKFNLLLMTMMDNDKYYTMNLRSMKINFRRLVKVVSDMKRAERIRAQRRARRRSISLKKLDTLKRQKVKKIFDSLKIIYKSLAGKNKVPSKLTKLALKGKKITKALKKKTPKIIKLIAQKIKNVAKSQGKATPKVVKQLSSTVGVKDVFVPNTLLKKLLKEKKISTNDAAKLKELTPQTTLKLLREREIKRIPQIKIVSPKIGVNDVLIPAETVKKLLADKQINKNEAYKLRRITPKSVLKLLKEREIIRLGNVKEVSSKLTKNVLDRIRKIYTPKMVDESKSSTPSSKVSTPVSKVSTPVSRVSTPVSRVSTPVSISISKTPSVSSKSKLSISPSVSITPSVSASSSSRTLTK
jgi:hypothetical protein